MISTTNQVLRITYEAYSKFSNALVNCRSFTDVAECFKINLKYLFNYYGFRACYSRDNFCIHMEITPAVTTISVDGNLFLQPYEEELRQTRIPRFFSNANEACLPTAFNAIAASRASELWAWNFSNDDKEVLVSILSGDVNRFSKNDIPILKLVCESLESKLLELCLFKELDEKNLLINQIVEQQKEIIIKRTSEIEQKNKTLLEISVLNAHDVRKPLSRILGLISLFDFEPTDVITEEVIPKLKTSSNDLDTALQNIIKRVTSDLIHLKA